MKRVLLSWLLLALCAAPASAAAVSQPKAPKAALSATTPAGVAVQASKLIYSSWEGEEIDRSFPPIRWPHALKARSDSDLSVSIKTSEQPEIVEIRMWKRLKANGIPSGKPHLIQCYFLAPPGECALLPEVSAAGVTWRVEFDPVWPGHVYVAVAASWQEAQVAWINHLVLRP